MIIPEYEEERIVLEKRLEFLRVLDAFLLAGLGSEDIYGMSSSELIPNDSADPLEPFGTVFARYADVAEPVQVAHKLKEIHGECYGDERDCDARQKSSARQKVKR